MALSIDSTTNLHIIDQAESLTGWTFNGISKTSLSSASREGTNCVGGQVSNASYGYAYHTHSSSVNMTTSGNERVYIWVNSVGPGTEAQNGWMVVIGDGTNTRAYTVGGSDSVPFSVRGWYCLMLDTANLPTTYQQVAGSGAPSLTAITQFGAGIYNTVAPSGNALNIFFDVVRYGSGIVVTSGATDNITLSDIADDDFSTSSGKAYGIIREIQPGVYGVQGDILFGDTAGNSIDWKETDSVVIFEDRVKGPSTNTKFKMSGQHSSTGTFSAELGTAVSSGDSESGRSGVIFISANPANQPVDFDFSDGDIEDVFLYGCTFTNMRGGTIAFSSDATNGVSHHISGCTFSGCSQVDVGRTVVRNCVFAATSDTNGSLLWNTNIDVERCKFIGNTTGAGVEHDTWNGTDSGTCTNSGSETTTMYDSGGGLSSVSVDDIVYNETDGSFGRVTVVVSDTELTHTALSGGTNNYWTNSDAYSVATPYTYTDLTFSGNTYDVDNSTSPSNVVSINKAGTSDPSSYPSGDYVVIQGSVTVKITVKDVSGTIIQNAQTGVFATDDGTEIINTDTNSSGIATTTYAGSTPREVKVWIRKASSGTTVYKNYSSVQNITSLGLILDVTLIEDPNNNATS